MSEYDDDNFDSEDSNDEQGALPPEEEYKVGYKKPPKHTQFPKGQSGNPRGRKKGSRGLKTDLNAELNRVLEVKMGSYRFKGTSQQLMLRGLALLAANGNLKASAQLVPLILTVFGTEDRGGDKRTLSPNDQAVLENFLTAFGGDASDDADVGVTDAPKGTAPGESVPPRLAPPTLSGSAEPEDDQ